MRPRTRTLAALAASAAVLVLGACSSSGEPASSSTTGSPTTEAPGTTGTTADAQIEAFCAEAEDKAAVIGSDEMDPLDEASFGEFVDAFLDVGQYAPPEIQDDWDTVSALIEDLYAMPSDERADELEGIGNDEEFNDAQDAVDAFMDEQCGFTFDDAGDADDADDADDATTDTAPRRGTSTTSDGATTTTTGEISVDALKAYLAAEHATASWFEQINGYLIGSSDAGIDVSVSTVTSWTVEDALDVCDAVAEWLDGLADDGSITIEDAGGVLAERPAGETDCAEA